MLNVLVANSNFHEIIYCWLFLTYSKAKLLKTSFHCLKRTTLLLSEFQQIALTVFNRWDLTVNKSAKDSMHGKFREWYCSKVEQQMAQGELMNAEKIIPVDLKMSIMKPVGAGWLFGLFNYLKGNPSILQNGFKAAGITDCLKSDIQLV